MQLCLRNPLRWPLLLLGALAVFFMLFFVIKTAGIEIVFQYNAHHMIRPSRIDPRIIAAPVPVHILRVGATVERVTSTV